MDDNKIGLFIHIDISRTMINAIETHMSNISHVTEIVVGANYSKIARSFPKINTPL